MSSPIHSHQVKGFSLVEVIIYMAIFIILAGGFETFIGTIRTEYLHAQTMLEVHDQGAQVIHVMAGTIRNARAITAPGTGSSGATLTVTTADSATNPTIFAVSGGVLTMKEGTGAAVPLTNDRVSVSSLSFANLSRSATPGVVRIRMTLGNGIESQHSEEVYSLDFYGSAAIR